MEKEVFGVTAYQFPTNLWSYLGPSRWKHWGAEPTERPDYPLHAMVASWQKRILDQLLSSLTLQRLIDNELKVPPGQDAFTAAELIERLTKAVFAELDTIQKGKFSNRQPAITSLRRNLQRNYLDRLAKLALGTTPAPDDCRSVARLELASLQQRISGTLNGEAQLDTYTRAHLTALAGLIGKVLDAQLELKQP